MRSAMVILLVACLSWPERLAAALDEDLAGRWSGLIEDAGDPGRARVTLRRDAASFEMDLALFGLMRWQGRMVPTARPGVFEPAAAGGGGLFDFFDGADRSNPFAGAPLVWSRTAADALIVYRLKIADDGTAELLRIALSPATGGVRLEVERRVDSAEPEHWRALLEPGS